VKAAVPCLLASVVYRQDFIQERFPEHHPILTSALFDSGEVRRLLPFLAPEAYNRCAITGMYATGLPPTTMLCT
jgi:hypothetical protein